MATRKKLGATVAQSVLKEFNHLCALCGKERPQIHHIDGNNSNNVESNLLPICPNHHLLDAHSPTDPIDPVLLAFFRRHKDPSIFTSQFKALFVRMRFLLELDKYNFRDYEQRADELVHFVRYLELGLFYSEKLATLLIWQAPDRGISLSAPQAYYDRMEAEDRATYLQQLKNNSGPALELLVELLRFQAWRNDAKYAFQA